MPIDEALKTLLRTYIKLCQQRDADAALLEAYRRRRDWLSGLVGWRASLRDARRDAAWWGYEHSLREIRGDF
jgi:hypothetical protein